METVSPQEIALRATKLKSSRERFLHPTDLGELSRPAFRHGLALALAQGHSTYHLLHVTSSNITRNRWRRMPSVRDQLERWQALPAGSGKEDVASLGVTIKKSQRKGNNASAVIAKYLRERPVALAVLGTHRKSFLKRFFVHDVALRMVQESGVLSLLFPEGVQGFVTSDDRTVRIGRILVCLDEAQATAAACLPAAYSMAWRSQLSGQPGELVVLHLGDGLGHPAHPAQPEGLPSGWEERWVHRTGDVVEGILAEAQARKADLLVVGAKRKEKLRDALHGIILSEVIQKSLCPILAVPI